MPGGWEWLIIAAVVLLLFGAKKLPEMARSVGQSARVLKGEMKGLRDDAAQDAARGGAGQPPPPAGPSPMVVDPYPVPPSAPRPGQPA